MKHLPRSPMNAKAPAVLALAAMLFATLAHAEPVAKMAGGVLVNASSMTLYTFDKDVTDSGKSVCGESHTYGGEQWNDRAVQFHGVGCQPARP